METEHLKVMLGVFTVITLFRINKRCGLAYENRNFDTLGSTRLAHHSCGPTDPEALLVNVFP